MAVEKSRVLGRFKAKWPKLNLSQSRLDALADKLSSIPADDADDAAIDALLDAQNNVLSFEEIARMDDRTRTLEAENKKLKETNPNPNPDPSKDPKTDPNPNDVPEWAKNLLETNKELVEKVKAFESGQVIKSKQEQLRGLFSQSDVFKTLKPEQLAIFEKSIDFESDTSLEEQVKSLESTASTLIQSTIDSTKFPGMAGGGGKPTDADEKMVGEVVTSLMG